MEPFGEKFTVVDLFCGAGGFSEGFKKAGFEILFGFDKCPQAIDTYRYNITKNSHFGDIRDYPPKDLLEVAGVKRNEIDIVIGGPPCQGFSTAGMMKIDDQRNYLYKYFIDFVGYVEPKIFVMENVPPIISHNNRAISIDIEKRFRKIGYTLSRQKLNAVNYGIPQLRERFFFAGSKEGNHCFPPEKTHEYPKHKKNGNSEIIPSHYISIEEAISDLVLRGSLGQAEMDYYLDPQTAYQKERRERSIKLFNHEGTKHTKKVIDRFSMFKEGDKISNLPKEFKTNKLMVKRLKRTLPSPTVMTLPDDLIHYSEPRILTVREMARLQSFDDTFRFIGKRTTGGKKRMMECPQYTLVGNAVPPLLAKAIAVELLKSPALCE